MSRLSLCRSCQATIFWARTGNDRAMPLDAEPDDSGNVVIVAGHAETYASPGHAQDARPNHPRYMPHFATCPNWRD